MICSKGPVFAKGKLMGATTIAEHWDDYVNDMVELFECKYGLDEVDPEEFKADRVMFDVGVMAVLACLRNGATLDELAREFFLWGR